jgi:hypothetical protein
VSAVASALGLSRPSLVPAKGRPASPGSPTRSRRGLSRRHHNMVDRQRQLLSSPLDLSLRGRPRPGAQDHAPGEPASNSMAEAFVP